MQTLTNKLWLSAFTILLGLNVFSGWVLFAPSPHGLAKFRQGVRMATLGQESKVLSVVYGDLLHNGSLIKVVKSQTREGIVLDFYSQPHKGGGRYLISQVKLTNKTNGFFTHQGEAVQLAVADLDGDGRMELLAPTFNKQMMAYLNPHYFSKRAGGFVPFLLPNKP